VDLPTEPRMDKLLHTDNRTEVRPEEDLRLEVKKSLNSMLILVVNEKFV